MARESFTLPRERLQLRKKFYTTGNFLDEIFLWINERPPKTSLNRMIMSQSHKFCGRSVTHYLAAVEAIFGEKTNQNSIFYLDFGVKVDGQFELELITFSQSYL